MRPRTWSGTGRRLFLAFSAFIALYALASSFALLGITRIHRDLERTRARVEGMRVALDLASAVRDQYAHVAHTIIIGNASHAALYAEARARVLSLSREMRRHLEQADEQAWVNAIDQATGQLDSVFRDQILPNVVGGDEARVQQEHHAVLRLVARIQERTERLTRRFEQSIAELQTFVGVVERRAFGWALLFLLVAPLVAAWVGLAIGRSVARPIARLQQGAERLASGDLETRIDIDAEDEFGALAHQFNAMTTALREHQKRLVQSERLAGIGALAAGVAHEINNPLGVILGYTRVLRKQAAGSLADDLGVIEEETLRCKEIVVGLLDLSRPLTPSPQAVDLRELCDDVATRLAESEPSGSARVAIHGHGRASGDATKLRQVMVNLIKNAIEAAGPTGQVALSITERADQVELLVVDSGSGVDAAARARLFQPFFTTKPRGTGLGLAVSQAIAHAHGGEITLDPAGPAGTCFRLRVPRHPEGGAA
ncbi:MAG: HAMP domain-containing protein [Proteobacteria bacterium]|nr:HAMP domain-containing protein [Pseudomonadota bacterium]